MTLIAVSTHTAIDIRCVPCRQVSADEERLLARFALTGPKFGEKDGLQAQDPLGVWLPRAALRACRAPAAAVTHSFAAAGLALSQDRDLRRLPVQGPPLTAAERPGRTLH
jgi:hypothetical protein